jgi:hypothetical protein
MREDLIWSPVTKILYCLQDQLPLRGDPVAASAQLLIPRG